MCPGPPGNTGKHDERASIDTSISNAVTFRIVFMMYLLLSLHFEFFQTNVLMRAERIGIDD